MADAAASGDGLSKSAKRRAAKKARDAAHEEEAPAPAPAPKAAAKPKAKAAEQAAPAAAEPKAKAKGKAKAQPEPPQPPQPEPKAKAKGKAKAQPQPEPPAPEPKAKAKGKAKAAPAPEPTPEPAPKAQGKQKAKAKAQKAPAPQEEEEQVQPQKEELINFVLDDGSGPAWETSTGLSKKQEKRKKQQDEAEKAVRANNGKPIVQQQYIPGLAPAGGQQASGQKGASQAVSADIKRIMAMKGEAVPEQQAEPVANLSTVTMNVPEKRIGVVIGPKGQNIKMLTEKTGVQRIDTSGQIFTISGEPAAVAKCQSAIQDLVDKGYCALMFEGFSENMVHVPSSALPDLIGKEGCIVRKIKEGLKVEVNFQDVGKGAPSGKKAKVTLAGSAESVEKAKNVINNIVMFGHDELTHPGVVHEELDVEEWQYRYIIGKGGSEMKHIQHNWKVKVNIPRVGSANEHVLVVGERDQVERAKAYIEKVIWNAEDAAKGRDRVDRAEDPWGDEEPEEPWMKQYLYKRS